MKKQWCESDVDIRKLPITKIIYNEGGYFGRPTAFVIDVRAGTFTCGTGGEMLGPQGELKWLPLWKVPDYDRVRFMELIDGCNFLAWQNRYCDEHCCDGTQWDLEVKSGRKTLRRIYGSNLWPDQWKAVLRLLKFCHSPLDFFNGPEEDTGD